VLDQALGEPADDRTGHEGDEGARDTGQRGCVELLDVAAAGIMLAGQDGSLMTVAASDERARLLELFEVQADEGPCRDCYRLGAAVVNVDLADAKGRWPLFTPP